MLDRDVLVLQAAGLGVGRVEQARQPGRDEDLPGSGPGAGHPGPAGQLGLDIGPQTGEVGAGGVDQAGDEAFGLLEQGEQEVLTVDLGVARSAAAMLWASWRASADFWVKRLGSIGTSVLLQEMGGYDVRRFPVRRCGQGGRAPGPGRRS